MADSGSFLARRLKEQQRKESDDQGQRNASFQGFDVDDEDAGDGSEAPAEARLQASAPVAAEAPKKRPEPVKTVGALDGGETLDTGYKVPPKRRTTPPVKKLRKQLRLKLLSNPEEADFWKRGDPDKEAIIIERLETVLKKMNVNLLPEEYEELKVGVLNDLLGFGAIEPMVQDRGYSEIMVNGPDVIFGEYKGKLGETEFAFDDEEHVLWTAQRIVRPIGRTLDRSNPMVDARLPDGSRVHIITNPSAINGTTITIRKFPDKRLTVADLIKFGSFTADVAKFLEACVVSRLNIVVSGGTGSGKTTLLNVLSSFIPEDERIVTVEDSAELDLAQRHVVSLETAPAIPGTEHKGKLEIRDLV
jgi:pilus assembly protein CpaF